MKKTLVLVAAVACFLSACSKPEDTLIPSDPKNWDTQLAPEVQKLVMPKDMYAHRYSDEFLIDVAVQNASQKPIKGVKADLVFKNTPSDVQFLVLQSWISFGPTDADAVNANASTPIF